MRGTDEAIARVADEWCAGIAHESNGLARFEFGDESFRRLALVVFMQRIKRRLQPEMR